MSNKRSVRLLGLFGLLTSAALVGAGQVKLDGAKALVGMAVLQSNAEDEALPTRVSPSVCSNISLLYWFWLNKRRLFVRNIVDG